MFWPDFDIVFWTYNWYRQPRADRLALLEAIPTGISLLVTFEMGDAPVRKERILRRVVRIGAGMCLLSARISAKSSPQCADARDSAVRRTAPTGDEGRFMIYYGAWN